MLGREASEFRCLTSSIMDILGRAGYEEFMPSLLAPSALFVAKAGEEVLGQMYRFPDKAGRDICLIPEVTAICQALYHGEWSKSKRKPVKVCYVSRCYRYERPQKGRYREFWQLGVENMGGDTDDEEMIDLLAEVLRGVGLDDFRVNVAVRRGLGYYLDGGFEVECDRLGAQKQIAGGGRYDCGVGWAIGIDRLMIAMCGPDSSPA